MADQLPPEQDESLIDMATRYGRDVMRRHPVITRGLASAVTDPLDMLQWLATHGVDPDVAATMTPEQMKAHQEWASSIPNAGELAEKYLRQAGVRESETLPEQLGELGVSILGPAAIAKAPKMIAAAPKALSWGKRILGKIDEAMMGDVPRMAGGAERGTIGLGEKAALKVEPDLKLKTDNPGGDWLKYKKQEVESRGRNQWGAPKFGSVTGTFNKNVSVPIDLLKKLPGVRGEQSNVRQSDLDWLVQHMKSGKLPEVRPGEEYVPFITVAHNGEAWVSEGNHRIMAANKLGWKSMPVEVRYFDGGEEAVGELSPDKIKNWINLSRFENTKKASDGAVRKKSGGALSRVNEAGNYTKPGMRKKLFNSIKASAVQGTKAGQWSARKAQLLAKKYKEKGGGYTD